MQSGESEELIKYIHGKLEHLSHGKNDILYHYVIDNSIPHSENTNGLFINLSLCPISHLSHFKKIINMNESQDIMDLSFTSSHYNMKEHTAKNIFPIIKTSSVINKDIKLTAIQTKILSFSLS
jgi:hypothetical protein|tara:strand:+ start:5002 stop:5370 length:369 start_codon:yes stop_codon:yes gene_type:complete